MDTQTQKAPKNLRRQLATIGAGAGSMVLAAQANAEALDVTGIVTSITENSTSLKTVATAVISVLVVVMVVNMVRRLIR